METSTPPRPAGVPVTRGPDDSAVPPTQAGWRHAVSVGEDKDAPPS